MAAGYPGTVNWWGNSASLPALLSLTQAHLVTCLCPILAGCGKVLHGLPAKQFSGFGEPSGTIDAVQGCRGEIAIVNDLLSSENPWVFGITSMSFTGGAP